MLLKCEILSLLLPKPFNNPSTLLELKPKSSPENLQDFHHPIPVSFSSTPCSHLSNHTGLRAVPQGRCSSCSLFFECFSPKYQQDWCSCLLQVVAQMSSSQKGSNWKVYPKIPTLHPEQFASLFTAIFFLYYITHIYLLVLSIFCSIYSMRSGIFVYFIHCWIPNI